MNLDIKTTDYYIKMILSINNDCKTSYKNLMKISNENNFVCDGSCENSLKYLIHNKIKLYIYKSDDKHIIYCKFCLDNKEYMNVEPDKERKCIYCKSLGLYYNKDIKVAVCQTCYNSDLSKHYTLLTNIENMYICKKSSVVIERSEIKELKTHGMEADIYENISAWLPNIENIGKIDKQINNIYYWHPISGVNEVPMMYFSTQLLLHCDPEGNGEVALVTYDRHIEIKIIYPNFESYRLAFEEWEDTKLSTRDMKDLLKEIKREYRETDKINIPLSKACTYFSGYVKLSEK